MVIPYNDLSAIHVIKERESLQPGHNDLLNLAPGGGRGRAEGRREGREGREGGGREQVEEFRSSPTLSVHNWRCSKSVCVCVCCCVAEYGCEGSNFENTQFQENDTCGIRAHAGRPRPHRLSGPMP